VADDWKGNTLTAPAGALSSTGMRYHELALQRWLNKTVTLSWGVPVPVVFTDPMDAFSTFNKLWSEANNPFQYLLDAKDENGNLLYQPYPCPAIYPLISVRRRNWKFRPQQNYSTHRMRFINWPTVSSTGSHIPGKEDVGVGLTLSNLAEVTTSRFPMAFDYRFQISHFCNRPDTQAFFLSQLFKEFWRSGSQLQTWIKVDYPGFGSKLVRLYVEGDIENGTPENLEGDKAIEFQTNFQIVLEGYEIDVDYRIYPALWHFVLREGSAPPEALDAAFELVLRTDLRENPQSAVISYRQAVATMPPVTSNGTT
jgi:hypothetical protein